MEGKNSSSPVVQMDFAWVCSLENGPSEIIVASDDLENADHPMNAATLSFIPVSVGSRLV